MPKGEKRRNFMVEHLQFSRELSDKAENTKK